MFQKNWFRSLMHLTVFFMGIIIWMLPLLNIRLDNIKYFSEVCDEFLLGNISIFGVYFFFLAFDIFGGERKKKFLWVLFCIVGWLIILAGGGLGALSLLSNEPKLSLWILSLGGLWLFADIIAFLLYFFTRGENEKKVWRVFIPHISVVAGYFIYVGVAYLWGLLMKSFNWLSELDLNEDLVIISLIVLGIIAYIAFERRSKRLDKEIHTNTERIYKKQESFSSQKIEEGVRNRIEKYVLNISSKGTRLKWNEMPSCKIYNDYVKIEGRVDYKIDPLYDRLNFTRKDTSEEIRRVAEDNANKQCEELKSIIEKEIREVIKAEESINGSYHKWGVYVDIDVCLKE